MEPKEQLRKGNPSLEGTSHSIEDTGAKSGDKLDQLLDTAVTVKTALNRRTAVFAGILVALATLWYTDSRQTTELREIAEINRANGQIARDNSEAIKAATGAESRARSAATLAGAIKELERVGVCAALYATDEFHPACTDISAVMDRVVAGENPYAK